jgi:Skp family chaperone for outer membrane proteins
MRVLLRASSFALFTSLIVAGTGAAQAPQGTATPAKIAYINSAALLAQAPGRAEAEAQFDREVGV